MLHVNYTSEKQIEKGFATTKLSHRNALRRGTRKDKIHYKKLSL